MKHKHNTYRQGKLTFIFYETDDKTYIAACNELCVLVEEKDKELATLKMYAKCKFYIESIIEDKLGEHLLNQSLPVEIMKDFFSHLKKMKNLEQGNAGKWDTTISDFLKSETCFV